MGGSLQGPASRPRGVTGCDLFGPSAVVLAQQLRAVDDHAVADAEKPTARYKNGMKLEICSELTEQCGAVSTEQCGAEDAMTQWAW